MFDLYGMSTTSFVLLHGHYAITNTYHRCAHRCCVIYTCVGTNNLIDRMLTCVCEFRRYTFVIERGLQEGFAQTVTFCIKIVGYLVLLKPICLLPTSCVVEVRCVDSTNADAHTIHILLLVIHTNRIALL